jgi:hypothetical protein
MTPERKAKLYAELEELSWRDLDSMTAGQEAVVDRTQAVWGGEDFTPAKVRWVTRQMHLPEAKRRAAINSVLEQTLAATQEELAWSS